MDSDFDFEPPPETIRVAAPSIPPEAMRDDEDDDGADFFDDEPTLVIVPSAMAALAERSAPAVASIYPLRRSRAEDEATMRHALIGMCAVAAVIFAAFGILVP